MNSKKKLLHYLHRHDRHADYLKDLEAKASHAYDLIMDKMIAEILTYLKGEKLIKSEEDDILRLTAPRLTIDLQTGVQDVIDKYLQGLRYILTGPAAGDDAQGAIEAMRIFSKVPAGVAIQSFLASIDHHRDSYQAVTGDTAPAFPDKWLGRSLDVLQERCARQMDQNITELRNRVMHKLDAAIQEQHDKPRRHALEQYKATLEDQEKTAAERRALARELISNAVRTRGSLARVKQDLKDATRDYSVRWDLIVRTETALAAGVASAQTISVIAGLDDPIVAIFTRDDDAVTEFCRTNSHHEDGSWKYFKLSSLKPPGYNLGKKQKDWLNSQPLRHFNCFAGETRINTSAGYLTVAEMATDLLGVYGNALCVRQGETLTYQVDGRVSKKGTLDHHYRCEDRQIESARPVCVGQQQIVRFTLKDGHTLTVSSDHSMKVYTANAGKTIPAHDVKVGDMIPIQGSTGLFGQLHFPDVAELMGSCLGDGVFGKNNIAIFYFFGKDLPYGESLKKKAMLITNGRCSQDGKSDKGGKYNLPHVRWSSAALWRIFGDLGMVPKYTGYKVPTSIWQSDQATVGSFLRGLYSADGSVTTGFNKAFNRNTVVIALTSKSLDLLREIQILLGQFGIIGHIYTQDKEGNKKITYADGREFVTKRKATWRLMVSGTTNAALFLKYIGFGQDFKNKKIQHIIDTTPKSKSGATRCCPVQTIEHLGMQDVYAISIPEYQSVIANGVVTGNCRCELVYIPQGFKLTKEGSLWPLEPEETLDISK